ncbi:MAG: GNAT family N-acetyltransferase, partial [Rhodospirillaceae bacterium]
MTGPYRIVRLEKSHDRRFFDCGVEALNRYFHQHISQDMRRRIANGFVALDPQDRIAGFYTLSATGLLLNELGEDWRRKLPRYPMVPAGLIGRLAVDHSCKGVGLGSVLIVDAIRRLSHADPAVHVLVVDAKDQEAVAFYRHFGFMRLDSRPLSLFL